MCQNPLARETVRLLSDAMSQFDTRRDAGWPLRKTKDILNYWVRCLSQTYGHMFQAEYVSEGGGTVRPPASQTFVMSRVHMSCQTLFFEATRRTMMAGQYYELLQKKMRIIYRVLEAREELAFHSRCRLCCDETAALMSGEHLAEAEGPNLGSIGEVPWLACEVHAVCEPGARALEGRVRDKHHEMYREFFHTDELNTQPNPSEPSTQPEEMEM